MGWAYPQGWGARRRRQRLVRRVEAGLVGVFCAAVVLILKPPGFDPAAIAAEWLAPPPLVPTNYTGWEPRHASAPQREAIASHSVRVVDGDGLEIDGRRIRLHGVDAFEYDQMCSGSPCGAASERALAALVRGREVDCRAVDTDRYGRTVARCSAGGVDLGEAMVRSGHALAYRRYSTAYIDEEANARRAGRGAWATGFQQPEAHRRATR